MPENKEGIAHIMYLLNRCNNAKNKGGITRYLYNKSFDVEEGLSSQGDKSSKLYEQNP